MPSVLEYRYLRNRRALRCGTVSQISVAVMIVPDTRLTGAPEQLDAALRDYRPAMPLFLFLLLFLCTCSSAAQDPELKVATWNLENLAAESGDGCRPRSQVDYDRLRHFAARLNADVVALQEVENAAAVARVFDPSVYAIEVSRRPGRQLGSCRRKTRQRPTTQRTGFAINRARLAELGLRYRRLPDFKAIGVKSLRWATGILLEPTAGAGGGIQLLSVHLKSGCAYGRLDGATGRRQCRLLKRQRGILEEWIDTRASAGERFVLLGDFNRQLDQPNDDFWTEIDDGSVCTWKHDAKLGRRCGPGSQRPSGAADLALANAGRPFPFPRNRRYPYGIDHIVFDSVTARRIAPGSYAVPGYEGDHPAPSDHHPVSISLRLEACRACAPAERQSRLRRTLQPRP